MSTYCFFEKEHKHNWIPFLENYAKDMARKRGILRLPNIWLIGKDTIMIQAEQGFPFHDEAITLYRARVEQKPARGKPLGVVELLQILPWHQLGETHMEIHPDSLPMPMLIRLRGKDADGIHAIIENLYQTMFRLHYVGVYNTMLKVRSLEAKSQNQLFNFSFGNRDEVLDLLLFIGNAAHGSLSMWWERWQRNHPNDDDLSMQIYRPYEPSYDPLAKKENPAGIWLHHTVQDKPYLSVLEADAQQGGGRVILLDATEDDNTECTVVDARFWSIYFFNDPTVENLKQGIPNLKNEKQAKVESTPRYSRPFTLKLELRTDPERSETIITEQRLDELIREQESLEKEMMEVRSMTKWREEQLNKRKEWVDRLVRRTRQSVYQNNQVLDRPQFGNEAIVTTRKRLYLFYEWHDDVPHVANNWSVLQSLLMETSPREQAELRYTYCDFDVVLDMNEHRRVRFHIIGHGVGGAYETEPDSFPPALQSADAIYEQDPQWRSLGYNLYLPQGQMLYPPLYPDLRNLPIDTDETEDEVVRTADVEKMYNTLLQHAVYVPKGRNANDQDKQRTETFHQADAPSGNHIALLYQYNQDEQFSVPYPIVPVFIYEDAFQPISNILPHEWNQSGLIAGTPLSQRWTGIDHAIEPISMSMLQQGRRWLDPQFENIAASGQETIMQDLMGDLQERVSQFLQNTFQTRINELTDEHDEVVAKITELERDWDSISEKMESIQSTLVMRQTLAENIYTLIEDRINEIDSLTNDGIDTWNEFVERVIAVNEDLVNNDVEPQIQKALDKIKTANKSLKNYGDNIQSAIQRSFNDIKREVEVASTIVDDKTSHMQAVLGYLERTHDVLANKPSLPDDKSALNNTEIKNLRDQVRQLQDHIESLEYQLLQERQKRTTAEETRQQSERYQQQGEKRINQLEYQLRSEQEEFTKMSDKIQKDLRRTSDELAQTKRERDELRENKRSLEARLSASLEDSLSYKTDLGKTVFTRLADIVDISHNAEFALKMPDLLQPLRDELYHVLEELVDVKAIDIDSGKTVFDPNLHHGIATENNPKYPDNVVLRVLKDGYEYKGEEIRECQVIVNQLKE